MHRNSGKKNGKICFYCSHKKKRKSHKMKSIIIGNYQRKV